MSISHLDVSVRYSSGTYIARNSGKTASCTHSPDVAVKNLGAKIFGAQQRLIITALHPVSYTKPGVYRISPDPSQMCRQCGCTWYDACQPGCHWVEDDLCSACAGRAG
ncbi:hypothetical protein [Dickeya oryzae]|uniref:Uncharacterized protein n=1 Tax=Dickeya oryzae TaxID=1240404 RepID=A0AB39IMR2_9GAMM|nr:hypothetical protein [Dickeya oryzae]MCA6993570.1 hypothetical protein [Dickeya oryzae]